MPDQAVMAALKERALENEWCAQLLENCAVRFVEDDTRRNLLEGMAVVIRGSAIQVRSRFLTDEDIQKIRARCGHHHVHPYQETLAESPAL